MFSIYKLNLYYCLAKQNKYTHTNSLTIKINKLR